MTRSGFAGQNTLGTALDFGNAGVLRLTEPRSSREPRHAAVRAQLDLPDFFENLAGDHDGN